MTDDGRQLATGAAGSKRSEVRSQRLEDRRQTTEFRIVDLGFGIGHGAWGMEIKAGKARKTRKGSQVIGDG